MSNTRSTRNEGLSLDQVITQACNELEATSLKIQSLQGLAASLECGLRDQAIGAEDVSMLVTTLAQHIEGELKAVLSNLYMLPLH